MRKILITGAGSYIGTSFAAYAGAHYPDWQVDTLDLLDENWRERSFAGYDSVFHVAGIAHEKETKENEPLYYKVNRDLAVEVCERAKREGAGQFVFLSSMSVYGVDHGRITKETPPAPVTHYGRSKLQAEQGIAPLEDENFKVCVLRPPMVYGKGCRGNFSSMLRLVRKLPIFPRAKNERSMLHIDNLCCFLCMRMKEERGGLFFPQNSEYMNPSQMAIWIGEALGKKRRISRLLGLGARMLRPVVPAADKAFGTLIYEDTEDFGFDYCVVGSEESVKKSV